MFRKEALCGRLAEGAMSVTRQVVEAQNGERKAFMQHLRRQHAARNRAATRWQRLVLDHTHDKGEPLMRYIAKLVVFIPRVYTSTLMSLSPALQWKEVD